MGRAPCCDKVGLKKGRWTTEEDEILRNYIQTHGEGSWRSLPKNAGLLRCGKSCRLRWINYLRSDVKRGNITPQEEDLILKLRTTMGNKWSLIASHLPGRTDNEIKNYWNSHLSRKIHYFKNPVINTYTPNQMSTVDPSKAVVEATNVLPRPPKRRGGGRKSRAMMKKNRESFTTPKRNRGNVNNNKNDNIVINNSVESDKRDGTEMLAELLLCDEDDDLVVGGLVGAGSEPPCFYEVMQMGPHGGLNQGDQSCSNAGGGESGGGSSAASSNDQDQCYAWLDWEWDPLYDQLMVEDDYDQLWRSMEHEGSTASEEQQIMPWPLSENDDSGRFEESAAQSAKEVDSEKYEAMVAWLMS